MKASFNAFPAKCKNFHYGVFSNKSTPNLVKKKGDLAIVFNS